MINKSGRVVCKPCNDFHRVGELQKNFDISVIIFVLCGAIVLQWKIYPLLLYIARRD